MMPRPLAEIAGEPDVVSLLGTAGAEVAQGVPIRVERWFRGDGIAPVVWLDPSTLQGGDDGGLCGTEPLDRDTRWVIVAWRFDGRLTVDQCAPHARADQPAGLDMLAELTTAFGPGIPVQAVVEDDTATVEALMPLLVTLLTIAAATLAVSAMALALFARRGRER